MRVYREGEIIYFHDKEKDVLGFATYDEDFYEKVTSVTWHKNGDYIRSSKLNKYLHVYAMEHWYGEDRVAQTKKDDYIVEHFNNEGHDCQIHNLYFAPQNVNKAKGFIYDPQRKKMVREVAINFFKDFESGLFQITLGFNRPTYMFVKGKDEPVDVIAMNLLYENDFTRTYYDAQSILHDLETGKSFDLKKLHHIKMTYEEAIHIPHENIDGPFFEKDGQIHMVISDNAFLNQIAPDKSLYKKNNESAENE